MKKFLLSLFALLSFVISAQAQTTTFDVDGITYRVQQEPWDENPGEVYVTKSSNEAVGYTGDITIPATVVYTKTYKVTGIDSDAFKDCSALTSISIPEGVTNIEWEAFKDCTKLTSVTIPNSVTTISDYAFQGCSKLDNVTLSNQLTSIGGCAFIGCTSLSSITFPNSVTTIYGNAFAECTSLSSITIPNSVTRIGEQAFRGCSKLTSVTLNDQLKKIEWGTFQDCTLLSSITIPNSVTKIENSAFSNCENLSSITIPNSVTKIESSAFYNCSKLTSIDISGITQTSIEMNTFQNCASLTSIEIPSSVTKIESGAFSGCISLTSINIPDGVTIIKGNAFYDCKSLTSIVIPNSVTAIGNKESGWINGNSFSNCIKLTSVTLSNQLETIENNTFSGCTSLESITIPSSVTKIGEGAFSGCSGLKVVKSEIASPYEVQAFDWASFQATLVVPTGTRADYKSTNGWKDFATTFEEGDIVYDNERIDEYGIIYRLKQADDNSVYYTVTGHTDALKTEIVISSEFGDCPVKAIEGGAFNNCSSLASITIPSSVTIKSNPFYDCKSLNEVIVVVKDYSEFCNNHIFGGFDNPMIYYDNDKQTWVYNNITVHLKDNEGNEITDYVIPEGVEAIGNNAFKGCANLTSVTIPNSVTSIGSYAFSNCTKFTSITIPSSVTSIGEYAFSECNNLIRVTSEISTPFDVNAFDFKADPLGLIDAPILIVPKGSRSAYKDKSGWGFAYTFEKGETIYDRNQADKQGLKYTLNQANDGSFYYSVTGHSEDVNSEIVIPAEIGGCPVKAIEGSSDMYNRVGAAFYNCSDLTSVKLGKNVTSIGDYAFYNCSNLNSITLPKKLESIGNYAFSGEDSYRRSEGYKYVPINSIVIPGSVKTIGNGAFYGCRELVSISFEKVDEDEEGGLTSIGDEAFRSCSFPSITLPNSVKTIGWGAFVDNLLTTVTLGDAITEIKRETFYNCSDLASVTIPDGVTSIEERAFEGCGKLTSVKLPKSLTSMGENVFESCPLTSIELPDAFTVIPANIFKNNNLKYIRLGNNVQSIGKNAFGSKLGGDMSYYNNESDSEELIVIEIGTSTPPQIDKKAFPNLELSDINVIVPDQAAQSAYRSADVWGEMQLSNKNNFAEVTVETAGNIGSELRSKCKMEPSKVVNLKVNGTINAKDFSQMKLNMNSLLRLDLSDCDITEIPNEALSGKAQLQELKLPTKLKTIGQSAFKGCTYLTGKLDLPSVTSIGEFAFQGTNYTEVRLPRSLKTIGAYAFYNLPLEQRLEIPSGVTSIGDYAFADTHIHSRLELPDDVNLGAGAFKNTNISKLQLPRNIKSLSREAFQGCTNLEEADFSNTFTEVFDYAFDGCSSMTYVRLSANTTYLGEYTFRDTQLEYLNVPSNVEVIKQGLLKNCKNLQSLSLPANVQTLETEALSGCSGLRNMSVEAIVPPTVKKNAFRSINTDLCLISIPTQSIDLYGNADYWGRFVNMRNDIAVETEGNGEIAFESVEEGEEEGSSMSRTRGQRIAAARAKTRASGEEEGDLQWTVANNGSSVFVPKYGKVRFFITPAVGETITSATLDGVDITNDIVDGEYVAMADNEHGKLVVKFSGSAGTDQPTQPTQPTALISIGKAGKASYCGDQSLDFSFSDEVKAYIATGFDKDEGTIWLTRVKDVPAGVPVLIKGEANKTYDVPVTNSQNSYYTNMFVGNTSGEKMVIQETDGDMVNYYLSGDGTFKSVNKTANIGTNKCYLQLPGTFNAAVTGATETVTVGSIGKTSFAAPVDLDFTNVSGLKAFTATGYDKSTKTIWLTRVMKVQKGEGVLLKGDPNSYEIPSAAVQSSYENMFVGNTSGETMRVEEMSADGSQTNFYLKGDGSFVSVNGYVNIKNNKCFLELPTSMVAVSSTRSAEDDYKFEEPEVIKLPIEFKSIGGDEDGTTSIRNLTPALSEGEGEWYTLQGQRVAKPGKGVYIRNGKKVVIK